MHYLKSHDQVLVLDTIPLPSQPKKVKAKIGHHILVVDRSGSMSGDIQHLKATIEQALAVEYALRGDVLTTLISFSSHGDVKLHWEAVPTSKVCDLAHPYLSEIRSIRATYLTGISQGLNLALTKVKSDQTTAITLFTDGYANDPSASQEIRNLDAFVAAATKIPGLIVNCIGYRDWCDWPRMQSISNALSGKTLKAASFSTVLEAMNDTQVLLAKGAQPALIVEKGTYDMIFAINRTTGQVNAAYEDMALAGVGKKDTVELYGVNFKSTAPKGVLMVPKANAWLYGAMVVGLTSNGDYYNAKGVLYSSGNKTLWEEHKTAITPSALADMTNDMLMWVKLGNNDSYEMGKNAMPKFSLYDLADTIESLPEKSLGLSDSFYDKYRRRSEKSEMGKRLDDGTIQPLRANSHRVSATYIRGLKFNNNDATVQLQTNARIEIRKAGTNTPVREVAHVSLDDMQEFRDYTIVSSGERNVDSISMELYSKPAHQAIMPFLTGPAAKKPFKAGMTVSLNMKNFNLVPDESFTFGKLTAAVQGLQASMAEVKLLSAMQDKVEAAAYSREQIEALGELHITPNLYFSPPSHTPFDGKEARQAAISEGKIDSYTRFKVNFGTVDILSGEDFRSGNEFLAMYYTVTANGEVDKKPKLSSYLQGATYEPRVHKGTVTRADIMMKEFFDKWIGMKNGTVKANHKRLTNDKIVKMLKDALRDQDRYRRTLNSLVMYIGCTGLVPRELSAELTRYEPDAFTTKFAKKLGKDEKEGIFYVYQDNFVISVVPETSWYSTQQ